MATAVVLKTSRASFFLVAPLDLLELILEGQIVDVFLIARTRSRLRIHSFSHHLREKRGCSRDSPSISSDAAQPVGLIAEALRPELGEIRDERAFN